MKYLLLPLALVAGHAMACPGDNAKDAMAPASASPMAAKATPGAALATALAAKPAAQPTRAAVKPAAPTQGSTQERVASKSPTDQSKAKAL